MRPGLRTLLVPALAVAALLLVPMTAGAQCPMCRTAFQSPEGQILARAFGHAILFLLAVPFAAVGVIAALIVKESRAQAPPRESD